jgi:hypothetical protein
VHLKDARAYPLGNLARNTAIATVGVAETVESERLVGGIVKNDTRSVDLGYDDKISIKLRFSHLVHLR